MLGKEELRQSFLEKRSALNQGFVSKHSSEIIKQIQGLEIYQNAKTIAIYYPMNNEIDLLGLLGDEKRFCFPKVISFPQAIMDFFEAGSEYQVSSFGIHEPTGKYVSSNEIDLFIVPGVVFSKNGGRLGYGKGFYDHYLFGLTAPRIGVLHHIQLVEDMPLEEHDVLLDYLVSEEETICIQPSS